MPTLDQNGSPKGTLNKADLKKIAINTLLAGAAGGLLYLQTAIPALELSGAWAAAVPVIVGLVSAAYKFFNDTRV